MHDFTKWAISAVSGAVAALYGQYGLFFAIVALAVVLDVITGFVKCKATSEGLSSKKANIGFWKKMSLFAALFFGIFLDFAAARVFSAAGVTIGIETPFALIVSSYIILNESISIAENLYLTNPDSFPKWIAKRLRVAREEMEREVESEEQK